MLRDHLFHVSCLEPLLSLSEPESMDIDLPDYTTHDALHNLDTALTRTLSPKFWLDAPADSLTDFKD